MIESELIKYKKKHQYSPVIQNNEPDAFLKN
jgi:hypothetical protein